MLTAQTGCAARHEYHVLSPTSEARASVTLPTLEKHTTAHFSSVSSHEHAFPFLSVWDARMYTGELVLPVRIRSRRRHHRFWRSRRALPAHSVPHLHCLYHRCAFTLCLFPCLFLCLFGSLQYLLLNICTHTAHSHLRIHTCASHQVSRGVEGRPVCTQKERHTHSRAAASAHAAAHASPPPRAISCNLRIHLPGRGPLGLGSSWISQCG